MSLGKQRRTTIKGIVAGTAAITASGLLSSITACAQATDAPLKGNINHSVCRWCFNELSVDELCKAAKGMGIKGIDLVGPKDWPTLQKYGLESTMCNGAEISLTEGWNNRQYHDTLI
ncbi:MAG: hydroxypyruvate isomerase, partial [Hymenobacteraceae bacterium]|nr:hydroxypyruvate isomerase [Hymenobacteraceae bacterium]